MVISCVQAIAISSNETQALILSPTRALARDGRNLILALGDFTAVRCHACIGGESVGEDARQLDNGVHIVSGTPQDFNDMIRSCHNDLRTRHLKMLVIDKADEMLNKGCQRRNLRYLSLASPFHTSRRVFFHNTARGAGYDHAIHE